MSKEELRKEKRGKQSVAGDWMFELKEVKRLEKDTRKIDTLTDGCSGFLTLVCC